MTKTIEIKSRFDTSDFDKEIRDKLVENGFIEYIPPVRLACGIKPGGLEIKKPFVICIKGCE